MEFSIFRTYLPKDIDIRPDVANFSWLYIESKSTREDISTAAAIFLNTAIEKTKCQKHKFDRYSETDAATNKINGWRRSTVGKRGSSLLPQAVFYWFFRWEPDPAFFIELAKLVWKNDPELLKRFCYAKGGGRSDDPFETILNRFHSEGALSYNVVLSGEHQRLPVTYAAAIELGPSYQAGREEFLSAKQLLLSKHSKSVALTAAIHGAGGYGKSSISQELCNDNSIKRNFPGGIYWLQFGLLDNNDESIGVVRLSEAIDRMLAAQYLISERPALVWNERDSDILKLVDILPSARLLLIADDLWVPKQSSWFSEVPANVSVLMTTRRQSVAKQATHQITIQRLTHDASYKLLTHGMTNISPDQQKRFKKLGKDFKGWPLLLGLANGVFKQMDGNPRCLIDRSIKEYEQFLADDQIDAWDVEEAGDDAIEKRRKLVGFCIEAGLEAIPLGNNPEFLRKLCVFPNNTDVPFSVIIDFWNRCGAKRIGSNKGLTLLRHFNDFSFFASFNEGEQHLKLHDEILNYFRTSTGAEQENSLHRALLDSIQGHCNEGWHTLPHNHTYGWTQILRHFEKANLADEADDLRTDFYWLKAKLASVGALELQRSFSQSSGRADAQFVGRAIQLSVSILSMRPEALAHQLFGRLGYKNDLRLIKLIFHAKSDLNFWPIPIKPHLPSIGSELMRLLGHSALVSDATFDQKNSRIVTASGDKTARLWDAETAELICNPLEGHAITLKSAAFDPNGNMVVTASEDSTARLWDAETGIQIGKPLEGHNGPVNSAVFDPSGGKVVTASSDKTVRLWDVRTGVQIGKPLYGHNGPVNSAAFDPSGNKILTASSDKTARLWDAKTGKQISKSLSGHSEPVNSAVFDPSGSKIVTASNDKTVRIWNAKTGKQIGKPLKGHNGPVNSAVFDPKGSKIVTASDDMTARIWDVETGMQVGVAFDGHNNAVKSAVFDRSGRKILTASWDDTARIWDTRMDAQIGESFEKHNGSLSSAAFDPSGSKVVTASQDKTARIWDAKTGTQIGKPFEGHRDTVNRAVFNPSGSKIVTASWDKTARLWNVETGLQIGLPLEGHSDSVISAAFDSSGSKIVTASSDKTARLWNAETGAQIGKPLHGHTGIVSSAVFDPTGTKVVTASWDKTARLWDAETGRQIGQPLKGHNSIVKVASFNRSGSKIVTASDDATARLWDAETGAQICQTLKRHTSSIISAAFDPIGKKVVTASWDKTARLWDVETGTQIGKPLEGHCSLVNNAIFDSTGERIITVSWDMTARIWNVKTGECLAIIYFDSFPFCIDWHCERLAIGLTSGMLCIFLTIRDT